MRGVIAIVVALGVGGPVQAQPAAGTAPATDGDEADRRARAEKLYQDGLAQFDTAEYLKAIDLWTEAYRILPNTPESADIKRYITNNLAVAREKQYAIDGDVQHLKRALHLAQNYRDNIDALYGDDPRAEQERKRTDEFLARVQAKVDEAEGGAPEPEPLPPPDPRPTQIDRAPARNDSAGRGAIVAGSVLLGLGGATGILLLAGVGLGAAANDVDPDDSKTARGKQFDRGRAGNAMAITGAVLTPLLLASGIALVVIGTKRKKSRNVTLTPTLAPDRLALTLGASF